MPRFLKIITLLLLLFNGITALYGGWQLMAVPNGDSMDMPLFFLDETPFTDYFIPGLLLFIINGVFSFVTLVRLPAGGRGAYRLVLMQGLLLTGWIIIQAWMIRFVDELHYTYGGVGLALILLGILLGARAEEPKPAGHF